MREVKNEMLGLLTTEGFSIPLMGVVVEGGITGRPLELRSDNYLKTMRKKPWKQFTDSRYLRKVSVCGFKAVIGDRTIQDQVEEKEAVFKGVPDTGKSVFYVRISS
jgi:hypothetical protein